MVTVAAVLALLNELAPFHLAEEWDNVGLLLGDSQATVKTIGIALDVVPDVLAQARRENVDCLITHHPLLFQAQKQFLADRWPDRAVMELLRCDMALVAAHTNLDKADGGVNDCLAACLQLQQVRPLAAERLAMRKLVVFVPKTHTDQVARAMADAGAGRIGRYKDCSFRSGGVGVFRPLAGAKPYIGALDELQEVAEDRLETIVPAGGVDEVIRAMLAVHPYEEPAYDIFALLNDFKQPGLGRIGELSAPLAMSQVASLIRRQLPGKLLRFTDTGRLVKTVALCGGSGSELWRAAQQAGADLLITADCKYHEAQHAWLAGMNLLDLGHDDSERPVLAQLAGCLRAKLQAEPAVKIVVLDQPSLWRAE